MKVLSTDVMRMSGRRGVEVEIKSGTCLMPISLTVLLEAYQEARAREKSGRPSDDPVTAAIRAAGKVGWTFVNANTIMNTEGEQLRWAYKQHNAYKCTALGVCVRA